jgi:hypothetical protein
VPFFLPQVDRVGMIEHADMVYCRIVVLEARGPFFGQIATGIQ